MCAVEFGFPVIRVVLLARDAHLRVQCSRRICRVFFLVSRVCAPVVLEAEEIRRYTRERWTRTRRERPSCIIIIFPPLRSPPSFSLRSRLTRACTRLLR